MTTLRWHRSHGTFEVPAFFLQAMGLLMDFAGNWKGVVTICVATTPYW